jgi:hypothetical protein
LSPVHSSTSEWLIGPGQKSGRLSSYTAKPSRRYFRPPAMQASSRHPTACIFIECVSCECKKACQTKRCSCFKANLKCTELCQSSNPENSEIDEELNWQCQWLWWGGNGLWWWWICVVLHKKKANVLLITLQCVSKKSEPFQIL